ncbi:MAG: helix-turn-helix domain-containing protein [Candidatus Puniceispirillum sp.]|nr:helix-turn-helix domain-containing protein [Candidatus Puniceispirillum sp.]MBL6775715.1 helix-turn-helix domain-containing protein [Candidatus Puniceispirillum sp.]
MKRKQIDTTHEDDLFDAILALENADEARNFFYDLCTPTEIEGLIDRWRVAQMLVQKVPYRKIAEETNVSTATIVRVARFLNNGFDGYKTIMQRQGKL